MRLHIVDKNKKDIFVSLFHLLKSCSNIITIIFNEDNMYIQGMDKAHVCLFDIKIMSTWFDSYVVNDDDNKHISIDTVIFHNIISMTQEHHSISIHYDGDPDSVCVDLTTPSTIGEYNKFFKIPLSNLENQILSIPEVEYDAEFMINAKKISEIISQMLFFGEIINIRCSEEDVKLISTGIAGEMIVIVPIDDLTEYSITEGDVIDISYSLKYMSKMCVTNKLSSDIIFSICKNLPMRIRYDLGLNSYCQFFIAPKISD